MVPFEFGEAKKNLAEEARAKFQDKSIWVLSKVVFDKTQAQWIGSPKKLTVDLRKSNNYKQCHYCCIVCSC